MSGHPFTDVAASDADHLLWLVGEAHKPFPSHPITVGDIANEWAQRWKRAHPQSARPVAESLNSRMLALQETYRRPNSTPEVSGPTFGFDAACDALVARWPGIQMGEPERAWSRLPVILEINRLRSEVQAQDETRYTGPVRAMR